MNAMATERFIVEGRVQGVGFRDFTRRAALQIGVNGYVRNQADGSVECVASGSEEQLEELARQLQQGPPLGRVEQIYRTPLKMDYSDGFRILF